MHLRLEPAQSLEREPAHHRTLEGARVLVVDDNETNRQILQHQLEGWHMRVAAAATGGDALRLMQQAVANQAPYDLGILDMHMPHMDGLQLATAIQAQPDLARTPLVMLTSTASSVRQPEREAAGIRHCLHKPVRRADLVKVICNLLRPGSVRLPEATAAAVPLDAPLQGLVLLAEDNPVNQLLAKAMLSKLGVKVILAQNGQEAIDQVAAHPFDLVMMDCQMPIKDGYAATAAIRARTAAHATRLPIIAVTANAMHGDERKCLDAGMDDFLAKPFTLLQLRGMLARWLPQPIPAQAQPSAPVTAPAGETDTGTNEAINRRTLDVLRTLDPSGGQDLIATVLRMFHESADANLQSVQRAIEARDSTQLSRTAHAMKSSAANIGADALASLYRRLETIGREGRIEDAQPLLVELAREQDRAVIRILEILREAA